MDRRFLISILALVLVLGLAACGPSAEDIAQMTAAAATNTPVPTNTPAPTPTNTPMPTATPIPYDLTVSVVDADGNAIPWAEVSFPESGDDTPVGLDDAGQINFTDLPGDAVTLAVTAQGYQPSDMTSTLERGPNELSVVLERDPYGLLPSDACGPSETLAYAEDLQDGAMQGWPEIAFNAPGWHTEADPDPERDGNLLVYAQGAPGNQPIWARLETGDTFGNAVWRVRFRIDGRAGVAFNWRFALQPFQQDGQEVFDSRYQLILGTDFNSQLRRVQQPLTNIGVGNIYNHPQQNTWYYLEVGTFDGKTDVYMDGVLITSYEDPAILPEGTFGFEYWPPDETAAVYFDDLSVCELSAPVETLFAPTEE